MPNFDENPGYTALCNDLRKLFKDAQNFVFDDFKSELAMPKTDLVNRLNDLATKAKNGNYDQ